MKEISKQLKELGIEGLPAEWFVKLPDPNSAAANPAASSASLKVLRAEALSCTKCPLSETRNKVVFGAGCETNPAICFVGEGPGPDEDKTGEPFVGAAGELLTAAITKGLKMKREDVYLCNVVKCFPPKSRSPKADEVEACTAYLHQQLKLINPKIIVTLGQTAQEALLGLDEEIAMFRGQWLSWEGIDLMPTLHPEYILNNPAAKKDFWADLQAVMRKLV